MDKVIYLFDVISDEHLFRKSCRYTYDHVLKKYNWESPLWFNSNSFQTLGAWIVSSFEKTIWSKYYEEKKSSSSDVLLQKLDSKISLEYKRNLVEFWKTVERGRKKKVDIY
jgi:hypothetical protein